MTFISLREANVAALPSPRSRAKGMAFRASSARTAAASWTYEVREAETAIRGAIRAENRTMITASPADVNSMVR